MVKEDPPYRVVAFDRAQLAQEISSHDYADERGIEVKAHVRYLERYLGELGARAILVETHYIDRDFLNDYAEHYVRCFPAYSRTCRRLHFFSSELTDDEVGTALVEPGGAEAAGMQDSYLGFLVVRPLPLRVIGRACLAHYPEPDKCFPTTREHTATLFGLPLKVQSVPFQEQDKEVAACATSALWTAFHVTGPVHGHPIPSPVAITRSAVDLFREPARSIPNEGLNGWQQAAAIRAVGMEPCLIETASLQKDDDAEDKGRLVVDMARLKAVTYAYLSGGFPCVVSALVSPPGRTPDWHAVTALGFRLRGEAAPIDDNGPLMKGAGMDRLYVHDDQAGPFSRWDTTGDCVTTSWVFGDNPKHQFPVVPRRFLVPLYHKVRISFEQVYAHVAELNGLIERSVQGLPDNLRGGALRPVWDIRLTTVNAFKQRLREQAHGTGPEALRAHLTTNLPRFMWQVSALDAQQRHLFDVLLDATDLGQGSHYSHCIVHNADYAIIAQWIKKRGNCDGLLRQKPMIAHILEALEAAAPPQS